MLASVQSDQSLMGTPWVDKGPTFPQVETKTQIRLCGSADRFESSLSVHDNLYFMMDWILSH